MVILDNVNHCIGCGACENTCTKRAIKMILNKEGFLYPIIDENECVGCGMCRNVCPVYNEKTIEREFTSAVAVHCYNKEIRDQSSSGGFFHYIANWVLDRAGVVYGVAWDETYKAIHIRCVNKAELKRLYRAKYSQSEIGECFQELERDLRAGKYVLFSGTPCQVAAVKQYLSTDYERLLLVDTICHGVPSPAVWREYVKYRSQMDNKGNRPSSVNMRSKTTGWPPFSVEFRYKDGTVYSERKEKDPFMRAFVQNLCLRKSCYDCKFKGIERISDFTLGDYWGIWNQMPEFDDGRGTSVVLLHSKQAKLLMEDIKDNFDIRELDPKVAVSENPSAEFSAPVTPSREEFMSRMMIEDFRELVDGLCPFPAEQKQTLFQRAIRKAKWTIKGMLRRN